MNSRIQLNDVEVYTHIGVPDQERAHPQKLLISLSFPLSSFAEAARSDEVTSTIDYALVRETILEVAGTRPRKLIETLAADLLNALRTRHQIGEATLTIEKFPLPATRSVVLTVESKPPTTGQTHTFLKENR